ncbi:hypothetical protein K439DRAFT_1641497 [Ramaria rubella]|nr:hypothetical protein K439DRAFT_1641497 [Ramaria rubella]
MLYRCVGLRVCLLYAPTCGVLQDEAAVSLDGPIVDWGAMRVGGNRDTRGTLIVETAEPAHHALAFVNFNLPRRLRYVCSVLTLSSCIKGLCPRSASAAAMGV